MKENGRNYYNKAIGKKYSNRQHKKKVPKVIKIVIAVFIVFIALFMAYVSDYYHSEDVSQYMKDTSSVSVINFSDCIFFDGPGEQEAVIFYPGAKVEAEAYAPLMFKLAREGVDCFLVKMPFNLAVFGINKADDILAAYDYEHWYMAGHSLGGAMAASYTAEHIGEIEGVILLAAYSAKDLTDPRIAVLSLYGNEDGVLNMQKLEKGREMVSENYTEVCIEGANHAGFGNYGEQKGDNKASLTNEEQQERTIEEIIKFIRR